MTLQYCETDLCCWQERRLDYLQHRLGNGIEYQASGPARQLCTLLLPPVSGQS